MTEQMNVPTLRFGEFHTQSIEQSKLGDLVTMRSGNTPSKSNPSFWEGTIPWISASSMRGNVFSKSEQNVTHLALESGAKITPKGSLLLLVRGSMLYNKIPVGFAGRDVTFNQDVKAINLKDGDDNSYLFYWFKASEHKLLNMVTGTGIGAGKLDTDELLNLPINQPPVPEQQKIASFLSKVDEKIGLLSEKKDKLTEYKRGVMQQLFNGKWHEQDGLLTFVPPSLRFKADDGSEFPDWEEKTLIELTAQGLSNGVFNDPKRIGKGYRLINVKDMYSGNFIDTSTLSLLDLSEKEFSKNQVKYGDIFFTRSSLVPSGIAYSNVNLSNDDDITYDGHLIKFSPNLDMMSPYYFANYLRSYSSRKSFISRGKQSTMTTIGQEDIKDISFFIPSLDEQTKIADLLVALDQKIDFTSSELENAKEWKKGLLQQMFV
ncbi:hypothetical protein BCT41_08715 [Vibrio splendidus]|uniref:restriction endonuclease subunit S n=3 Tax=Vibrio TaxID=662 RepID=UPI000C863381|nr:restriction endonuclease subunit S [Vibrio splendidus]PMN03368.1 hypothetical protein BCT41_08715 [Vibrio splendidus]